MWFAVGKNSYGRPAICGPFATDDEANTQAKEKIPGIIEIIELPTSSMQKAKSILKFRQAQGDHTLDSASMRIRGYDI